MLSGSKALSNVQQQFSKLNKLGTTFKHRAKQPKFKIGLKFSRDSSSDSEADYEDSIFQPNIPVETGTALEYPSDTSSSPDKSIERGVELTEDLDINKKEDAFLPGVGIVMGKTEVEATLERRENMMSFDESSQVNDVQLSSIMQNVSIQNPEIQISGDDGKAPSGLKIDHKLSHSSGEVDLTDSDPTGEGRMEMEKRCNSQYDVSLNISQSQSESALKNKFTNLTSPVANVTKDLVFSPFSKLAKGMQNLGANLDPRKLSVAGRHEKELEEFTKMQERWKDCKTRLIAL